MNSNNKKAFTLIELLVVIAIIAILASVTVIGYTSFIKNAAVSNDNALANQINKILSGYKVSNSMDTDEKIAEILQNNIDKNISIKSEKYDMNIYYNSINEAFELMSTFEGESNNFKTLHYFLGLQLNNSSLNHINFTVNSTYNKTFDEVLIGNGLNKYLFAKIDNNELHIGIAIDETGKIKKSLPEINLTDIISATNSSGEPIHLNYSCEIVDKVDCIWYNFDNDYKLENNILQVFNPGLYKITATYNNYTYSLNLYADNIYLSQEPTISVNDSIEYLIEKSVNDKGSYDISITVSKLMNNIVIDDYRTEDMNRDAVALGERAEYIDRMTIIIEFDSQIIELNMNNNLYEYTYTFENIDTIKDSQILIRYRYQGLNGKYIFSNEYIETVN